MNGNGSGMPELIFSPNHSGYAGDSNKRLHDFLHEAKRGACSWSSQKGAKAGDVYLFWFCSPVDQLAGIGVSDGDVVQEENNEWDWTDSGVGWFCGFDPLVRLSHPLALGEILRDRLLKNWWGGKPYFGRPKRIIRTAVANRLVSLILDCNPKQRVLARLLEPFLSQPTASHSSRQYSTQRVIPSDTSVNEYVSAFTRIRDKIGSKRKRLLSIHFNAPRRTATASQLAKDAGYQSWSGVNSAYGALGRRLCEALRRKPASGFWVSTLVSSKASEPSEQLPLTMRPNVARALQQLGIVRADHLDPANEAPVVWRMAMRFGNRGTEMWPQCRDQGVAAIAYRAFSGIDLRKHGPTAPEGRWKELEAPQRGFLRNVAFEMKKGDVIYVKQGPAIVGRGTVTGPYQFDRKCTIIDAEFPELPFAHQVPVEWDLKFPRIDIKLGAEPSTVLRLTGERLQILEEAIANQRQCEAVFREGAMREIRAELAHRDQRLRLAAIRTKGLICEVCDFDFEAVYGNLGAGFIEVHHHRPLSTRKGKTRKTSLKDVSVVCSNCHRMVHRSGAEPLSIAALRAIVRSQRA